MAEQRREEPKGAKQLDQRGEGEAQRHIGALRRQVEPVAGREIMRLASATVKKVSLELGGKGPVIVLDDADVDIAVDGALFACMLYSGQICESGTRLILPASSMVSKRCSS